jgi:D-alanyl-D-alanine dipeptidase
MTKIGHGGAVYGFSTQFEALPQRRLGVVAASSLDGSNGVVGRLAQYALRLMIAAQDGKPLPQYRTTTKISPQRASQLIGDYRDPKTKRLVQIFSDADNFWIHPGTFQHQLRAATDDGTLLVDDVISFGTEVTLVDPNKIKVDDVVYERIADEPPAECPSRWSGLIGEYGWDHNTLYIREHNGQLHALIEWFYDYPLTEVDENTFRFPDYGLYHDEGLTFVRDESGNATRVIAAEVAFDRREVGTRNGETFKIKPVKPIEELRAAAIAATPPIETGDFRAADLVELNAIDPTIRLDIRYATTNNFTGSIFYNESKALMQRPAAEAVARASAKLKSRGLGLLIHDAYRPWFVTKMFWDATPGELKDFVANPANGSRHNRGCAVDLTLYDLTTGQPIEMVAGYDEFSPRSFPLYPGGTSRQRWYRELLRRTMEAEDFSVYEYEWWHFDYKDWRSYRIGNTAF